MRAPEVNQPWIQLCLFERDVLEFTLKVGVERNGDNSFVSYEVRDPRDGVLVAMASGGNRDPRDIPARLETMQNEVRRLVEEFVWPFPER